MEWNSRIGPERDVDVALEAAVAEACRRSAPIVLAVSGGRDSMALLRAAARVAPAHIAAVATIDHQTGPHARAAAELVATESARLGLAHVGGRCPAGVADTEAEWRAARWQFLRQVAGRYGARVATAHTRDDHIETVVIRILRHAGARGLAALDTDGDVVRPWLSMGRDAVAAYAARHGVAFVEDPSNASRAHLRNRVRLDLLPGLRRARPTLDEELLSLAQQAADWRRSVERLVAVSHPVHIGADGSSVAAGDLTRYDAASLAVVWPALAARAGVTLDRRGTERLAHFTHTAPVGGIMQLSGGVQVVRSRFSFVLRRSGEG